MSPVGVQMVSTLEQCAWEHCRTFQRRLKLNIQNITQLKLHKVMAVRAVMCNCANCTSNGSRRWNTEAAKMKFLRSSAGNKLFSHKYRMNRCSPVSSIHLPSCLKLYLITYVLYIHGLPRSRSWRTLLSKILLTFFVLVPMTYALPTITSILGPQLLDQ
jgi:hypothetical protein